MGANRRDCARAAKDRVSSRARAGSSTAGCHPRADDGCGTPSDSRPPPAGVRPARRKTLVPRVPARCSRRPSLPTTDGGHHNMVSPRGSMRAYDLIRKKRDGGLLSPEELRFIVRGATTGEIADEQLAAFLMAVFFLGVDRGAGLPHWRAPTAASAAALRPPTVGAR